MDEIRKKLTEYIKYYKKSNNTTSQKSLDKSLDKMFLIEAEILEQYGLPSSGRFIRHFYEIDTNDTDINHQIDTFLNNIRRAAQQYHTEPVKTDLQRLQEAMEKNEDALDVLPEIGIDPNYYHLYVFGLMKVKRATIKAVEKELKKTMNPIVDGLIEQLMTYTVPRRSAVYKKLKDEFQLQYVDGFIDGFEGFLEKLQTETLAKIADDIDDEETKETIHDFLKNMGKGEGSDGEEDDEEEDGDDVALYANNWAELFGVENESDYILDSMILTPKFELGSIIVVNEFLNLFHFIKVGKGKINYFVCFANNSISEEIFEILGMDGKLLRKKIKTIVKDLDWYLEEGKWPVELNIQKSFKRPIFLYDMWVYGDLIPDEFKDLAKFKFKDYHMIQIREVSTDEKKFEEVSIKQQQEEKLSKEYDRIAKLLVKRYQKYLNALKKKSTEQEARNLSALQEDLLFSLAKIFYNLEQTNKT